MSDIPRFTIWGCVYTPAGGGEWVRYDDHRAEVERLTARQTEMETHITGLTAELHRTRADGIELRWVEGEVEQLTAQRDAAQAEVERLKEQVGALTLAVEQADEMKAHAEAAAAWEEAQTDRVVADGNKALAEVERLTHERDEARAERDAAQRERERVQDLLTLAGRELSTLRESLRQPRRDQSDQRDKALAWVKRLTHQNIERLKNAIDHLTSERDEAQAEVQRLQELLTEESKSLPKLIDSMTSQLRATADRLTAERDEAREKLARLQVQYDEFAKVTARVIDQHQRERDDARQQVYRLQQAGADRPTDQSAQNLDMANGQAILDSSRPTDEDIWREAFMRQLHDDHVPNWATTADVALAEYRKRWPR